MNKNYLLIFSSLLLLRSAFASSLQFDNPQGTTPEIRASCVQEATAEPFSDAMSSLISEHLADSPEILLDYPGLRDETRARIAVDLLNRLPIISETIDERVFALAESSTVKNEIKVNMYRVFLECEKIPQDRRILAARHLFESRLLNNIDVRDSTKVVIISSILNRHELSDFHHYFSLCLFKEKLFDPTKTTETTMIFAALSILSSDEPSYFHDADETSYFCDAASYVISNKFLNLETIEINKASLIVENIIKTCKVFSNFKAPLSVKNISEECKLFEEFEDCIRTLSYKILRTHDIETRKIRVAHEIEGLSYDCFYTLSRYIPRKRLAPEREALLSSLVMPYLMYDWWDAERLLNLLHHPDVTNNTKARLSLRIKDCLDVLKLPIATFAGVSELAISFLEKEDVCNNTKLDILFFGLRRSEFSDQHTYLADFFFQHQLEDANADSRASLLSLILSKPKLSLYHEKSVILARKYISDGKVGWAGRNRLEEMILKASH